MKREERNKETQLHTCDICSKADVISNMIYSKPRSGKNIYVCKRCYKKLCRGE